jgi:hypothetical protein
MSVTRAINQFPEYYPSTHPTNKINSPNNLATIGGIVSESV